jgi:glycosyltransferase involved in cell wall biosynthesis
MELSIVIPVYNEEENLPLLLEEITRTLHSTGVDYEIICVDDGSGDRSNAVLRELTREYPSLKVIELRRNFGQTAALQAGFDGAQGRVIIPMDADLQNDPADILQLLDKINEGYDVVAGWRANRKDRFLNRRLPSILANWLISSTTQVRLHDYGCTLKAIRSDLVRELRLYGELHRFIPAIASLIGARICEVKVNHRARQYGRSKYGIGRTIRVILDLLAILFIRSYLTRPIQIFGLAGLGLGGSGILICSWLVVQKFIYDMELADRPLLLLGILLILVGIQLFSIGLLAEITARTYHEAQNKPPYYIRNWIQDGKEITSPPRPLGRSSDMPEMSPEERGVRSIYDRGK